MFVGESFFENRGRIVNYLSRNRFLKSVLSLKTEVVQGPFHPLCWVFQPQRNAMQFLQNPQGTGVRLGLLGKEAFRPGSFLWPPPHPVFASYTTRPFCISSE